MLCHHFHRLVMWSLRWKSFTYRIQVTRTRKVVLIYFSNAVQCKSHLEWSEQKKVQKTDPQRSGNSGAIYILREIFEPFLAFWGFFGPFSPSDPSEWFKNHTFWNCDTKIMTKSINLGVDLFFKPGTTLRTAWAGAVLWILSPKSWRLLLRIVLKEQWRGRSGEGGGE